MPDGATLSFSLRIVSSYSEAMVVRIYGWESVVVNLIFKTLRRRSLLMMNRIRLTQNYEHRKPISE